MLAVAGVYRPNAYNNAQFILAPTRQLHCRRKGMMAARVLKKTKHKISEISGVDRKIAATSEVFMLAIFT